jgi:hypothetical protein
MRSAGRRRLHGKRPGGGALKPFTQAFTELEPKPLPDAQPYPYP